MNPHKNATDRLPINLLNESEVISTAGKSSSGSMTSSVKWKFFLQSSRIIERQLNLGVANISVFPDTCRVLRKRAYSQSHFHGDPLEPGWEHIKKLYFKHEMIRYGISYVILVIQSVEARMYGPPQVFVKSNSERTVILSEERFTLINYENCR